MSSKHRTRIGSAPFWKSRYSENWRSGTILVLATRLFVPFLVCGILSCNEIRADDKERQLDSPFNVGYRILDLKYQKDEQEKVLTIAIWYPTSTLSKSYNYGGSTNGKVAMDAPPLAEKGPYPMLVFSHGYGGSGLGAVFFTEKLAAHGWIVVAPDHHDMHSAVRIRSGQLKDFNRRGLWRYAKEIAASNPENRDKYLYRLYEMKLVIGHMIASENFKNVIDSGRVAVGGHSFGGYTALGLCGTIKERYDSRIKAVLLFSTGAGGYLFRDAELSAVRIPSMLFIGEREKSQLRGSKTMLEIAVKIHKNLSPPKYFLEIKDANHFSFNNRFKDNRRTRRLSGSEDQFEVIRRYSIAFLEKYVAGKMHSDYVLEHSDPMLIRYIRKPSPGLSKIKTSESLLNREQD